MKDIVLPVFKYLYPAIFIFSGAFDLYTVIYVSEYMAFIKGVYKESLYKIGIFYIKNLMYILQYIYCSICYL